jgi:hypothetical protein
MAMKVVVTNYTGDRGNWGCQTTSRNLLAYLGEVFSNAPAPVITTVPLPAHHPSDDFVSSVYGRTMRAVFAAQVPAPADLEQLDKLTR